MPHSPALHRLALVTSALTFALLIIGGLVSGTGSGLACPEPWFVCHGSMLPEMTGGVLYEHGHRLWAMGVGLCLTILAIGSFVRRKQDPHLWRVGLALFVLVCVQGAFGAFTVHFKLHPFVATAHLTLAMVVFSTVVYYAWRSRPRAVAPLAVGPVARRWVTFSLVAVLAQIVLGGFVRHTGSGLACGDDFPLCAGEVWHGLDWHAQLQVVHRVSALIVSAILVTASVKLWRAARGHAAGALIIAMLALLVTQIVLGILSVVSLIGLVQVTAHLGVGVLLLEATWLLRLSTSPTPVTAPASAPQAASFMEARS